MINNKWKEKRNKKEYAFAGDIISQAFSTKADQLIITAGLLT